MGGFVFHLDNVPDRLDGHRRPTTDEESQRLMLVGERNDEIEIKEAVRNISGSNDVPNNLAIIERSMTYFGPRLRLIDDQEREYLLTAPGPTDHLYLWTAVTNENGFKEGWEQSAEVKANLSDNVSRYHICPHCEEPLKTAEHERLALFGNCSMA